MQPAGAIHPRPRTPLFFACAKEKGGKERRLNAVRDLGSLAEASGSHMASTARASACEDSGAKASRVRAAPTSENHRGRAARADRDGGLPRARPRPAKAKAESRRVNAPTYHRAKECFRAGLSGPESGRLSGHGFAGHGQRPREAAVAIRPRSATVMVLSRECSRYPGCLSALIGAGRGRALVAMSAAAASARAPRAQPALKRLSFAPPFLWRKQRKEGVRVQGWIAPAGCIEVKNKHSKTPPTSLTGR